MSDIKRAVLTSLEPQKVKENVVKQHAKIVRIRVSLPESNEDNCPEFNYKDELAAAKKKSKQNVRDIPAPATNGLDPFGEENDDDVRRIALEMEAKYGSGVTAGVKKKRRRRRDDYADIGAGYDESDSFIDNTDGYDEIIPHNVTTARGGFYINSGALEFKTEEEAGLDGSLHSSEEESESEDEEEDEDNHIKKKRKRLLETSDEEGENSNQNSQKPREQNGEKPNISMQQAIKKKMFSPDKIQIKKQKLDQKNTVRELLKEKRTEQTNNDMAKENKKPMKLSSVDDAIDSVIGRIDEPKKSPDRVEARVDEEIKLPEANTLDRLPPVASIAVVEPPPTTNDVQKIEEVRLPENLPVDILNYIDNIKLAARNHKDGGKVKFFSGDVNVMLLNLERKCKVLGRSSRAKVYEHLAPFVKCRKETLLKRAKNLVFEDDQRKLTQTITNLKSQIHQLMPALITNHEQESQRILQRKFSAEAATNEELKNLRAPRKRFPLHDEMKRMIRDIVSFKKRCLLHEGQQKNSLEDLLSNYLKKEILVLWPDGWMSMQVLKKYCTSLAIKTPDPKALAKESKSSTSSARTIINYGSGKNITITPVNLTEKLSEVNGSSSIIVEPKDNGVIVRNTPKEPPAIPMHCQVIDLTDNLQKNPPKETAPVLKLPRDVPPLELEAALKTKFPALSVTANNAFGDKDDVQKVMESLKALQKLSSSPSKSSPDIISNPGVSVIAYNKNYSNSGSSQGGSSSDMVSFTGLQDDYQKQFNSSLNNHKSPPSKQSGYNKCS